jgi:hypothetical protein
MLSFANEEWWEDDADEPRETCAPLERINAWIKHGRLVRLTGPTYSDDAGYGMDANLYGGGYKHFTPCVRKGKRRGERYACVRMRVPFQQHKGRMIRTRPPRRGTEGGRPTGSRRTLGTTNLRRTITSVGFRPYSRSPAGAPRPTD